MNFPTLTFRGNLRRRPLVVLCFFALFVFAAERAADYVITEDIAGLSAVTLAFLGCALVVAVLNNWRNGLYLFLTWLLFEDLARKFLGNNMVIYFAKDVLVVVVYLSFFRAYRRKEVPCFRPPFLLPVLLFFWFGVMQVFNPGSTHILYGILGLQVFFLYIPLLLVGYSLLNSETELRKFFFVNLVLGAIIVSLGVVQAILGHSFLNPANPAAEIRGLSTLYRTSPVSGLTLYRPTSVFVSTGRFGDFLLVMWLLVFGFSGYLLLRHKRGRAFAFVVFALIAAGIALCSSRGVVLWSAGSALMGAIAFVWGAPWRQKEVLRVLRNVQRTVIGIGLAITILLVAFPEALLSRVAFYTETLAPSSGASELQHRTWDYPVRNFLSALTNERWLYGYGIGTASLGGQYVSAIFHVRPPVIGAESGFGVLVLEMGVGGLILWLVMSSAILISAWRVVRKLRGSPWFPIAFVIFWYAGLLLFPMTYTGMQPYQDFVLNAYLWLLLGILFRLPSIALSAQFAAAARLPQMYNPQVV